MKRTNEMMAIVLISLVPAVSQAQAYGAGRSAINGMIGGASSYASGALMQRQFAWGPFARETAVGAAGGYVGGMIGGPVGAAAGGFVARPIIQYGAQAGTAAFHYGMGAPIYGAGNSSPQMFGRANCFNVAMRSYSPC